ncbi:MAG: polyprenol monophosphomannose synthase [Thermoplasmata archaeon]|nr:polyprenol monophosphomannose synthase [Thermoplasmata archaeon]
MELTVLLPTYNEREALELVAGRLEAASRAWESEILVVDDSSPDGTGAWVRGRNGTGGWRLLERPARSGLASAVLDGFRLARGDVIAVMDADGSHPPESLAALVDPIRRGQAEMTVGSRHIPGGSDLGLQGTRRFISGAAALLARPVARTTDPMSGFFAVDRRILGRAPLTPVGYKIGLEVLVKCRPRPVLEVPFRFAPRIAGESKLGGIEILHYVRHLLRLYRWKLVGSHRASSTR